MKLIYLFIVTILLQLSAVQAADEACKGLFTKLDEFADLKDGDQVWGYYKCKSCGTDNVSAKPGHDGKQACPGCGAGHTDEDFKLSASATKDNYGQTPAAKKPQVITDKKEKELADSGRKWSCAYCATSNFMTDPHCRSCGGAHVDGGKAVVLQAEKIKAAPKATGGANPTATPPTSSSSGKLTAATVAMTAVAGGTYWALSTHEINGEVSALAWNHTIDIERFTKVTKSEFDVDLNRSEPVMPVNGSGESAGAFNVRSCTSKYYKDSAPYVCGTIEVPHSDPYEVPDGESCDMVSNSNGSFTKQCSPKTRTEYRHYTTTENKYCTDKIYKDYCDYDTFVWKNIDRKTTSGGEAAGSDEGLPWPAIKLGPLDRQIRSESYQVTFKYPYKKETETKDIKIDSESDFKTWKAGNKVKVFRRNVGGLSKWERI